MYYNFNCDCLGICSQTLDIDAGNSKILQVELASVLLDS